MKIKVNDYCDIADNDISDIMGYPMCYIPSYDKYEFSENFIDSNHFKFDWYYLIYTQTHLREEFIEKYLYKFNDKDNLEWKFLSLYYKLSNKFILKYMDKLYMDHLIRNKNINKTIIEKILLLK